jgi:hypothetical protein
MGKPPLFPPALKTLSTLFEHLGYQKPGRQTGYMHRPGYLGAPKLRGISEDPTKRFVSNTSKVVKS